MRKPASPGKGIATQPPHVPIRVRIIRGGRMGSPIPIGNSPGPLNTTSLSVSLSLSLSLSLGHAIFKLTYLSNHDYKHLYFESDAATVNEIVLKVSIPS
jgi:hypothetical protein